MRGHRAGAGVGARVSRSPTKGSPLGLLSPRGRGDGGGAGRWWWCLGRGWRSRERPRRQKSPGRGPPVLPSREPRPTSSRPARPPGPGMRARTQRDKWPGVPSAARAVGGAEVPALPFIPHLAAIPGRAEDVGGAGEQPSPRGSGEPGSIESLPAQSPWVGVCPGTSDARGARWVRGREAGARCCPGRHPRELIKAARGPRAAGAALTHPAPAPAPPPAQARPAGPVASPGRPLPGIGAHPLLRSRPARGWRGAGVAAVGSVDSAAPEALGPIHLRAAGRRSPSPRLSACVLLVYVSLAPTSFCVVVGVLLAPSVLSDPLCASVSVVSLLSLSLSISVHVSLSLSTCVPDSLPWPLLPTPHPTSGLFPSLPLYGLLGQGWRSQGDPGGVGAARGASPGQGLFPPFSLEGEGAVRIPADCILPDPQDMPPERTLPWQWSQPRFTTPPWCPWASHLTSVDSPAP